MQQHGYMVWTDRETGRTQEADTVQCRHCGSHVVARADAGVQPVGWCGRCAAPVCGRCAATGRCTPYERRLARALAGR